MGHLRVETIIILRCRSSFDCETIFMVVKVTGLFDLFFFLDHTWVEVWSLIFIYVSLCCRGALFACFLFQSSGRGRGFSVLSVLCEALRSESGVLGPRLWDLLV